MPRQKRRLHPVVEAYVSTDRPLKDILVAADEPRDLPTRATLAMRRCIDGEGPEDEALALAQSACVGDADPDMLIVLYAVWSFLSSLRHRLDECRMVLERVRSLVSPRTPPEIRALALHTEVNHLFYRGRKEEAAACSRQALAVLPANSPRRPNLFCDWAFMLATLGRGAEVEEEYARLADEPGGTYEAQHVNFRLCHCGETGRMAEARACAEAVLSGPNAVRFGQGCRFWQTLADVLLENAGEALPGYAAVLGQLLAGQVERAGVLARVEDEHTEVSGYVYGCRFDAFNMLRVDLANGRADAARRLIQVRRKLGNSHYLDDFFLARAELLAGNREEAARRFAAAYHACRRYRAERRLEIELRLACEMSRPDVMHLTAAAVGAAGAVGNEAAVAEPAPRADAGRTRKTRTGVDRLVGESLAMVELRRTVERVAAADVPVLITGETGTGKELVARAIHETGPRAAGPFVAVNCGSIAEGLLESELFGYERGAFTGAAAAHRGLFEEAGKGTILLDEIGDISPRLQVSLLRVLEAGEIRPVGSARSRRVRCRVVAATNADLDELVARGAFRKDLLFRLRRLEIRMPPLRERREDVALLAEHFMAEAGGGSAGRSRLAPELKARLREREWPGNVRELRNEIERMMLLGLDRPAGEPSAAVEPPAPSPVQAGRDAGPAEKRTAAAVEYGRSRLRQLERLRAMFREHNVLTRSEIIRAMGVSQATATSYLKALCAEGCIEKVTPTAAPGTHYFRVRSS